MMAHCPTRSHCANPFGVLHSASLRYGDSAQCHAAPRLAPVEYATVAQSLRSLRPHHSRIPPAQAFRPSWLRCERVIQRVITTGQPASEDINIAMERIMQNLISTETSQTAMACEQAALFGATPGPDEFDNRETWNEDEALAGSRKRSTSWPAPSHRMARSSPTNARACSGASSMHCTPRSSASTAASTRSRPK